MVYWISSGLRWPQPPARPVRRRTLLYPLETWLERELERAGLSRATPDPVFKATLASALLGLALAWPFRSNLLMTIASLALGSLPYQAVRARSRRRAAVIAAAAEPALVLIARLCQVRSHPFLAICDALHMLEPPLRAEFERAVAETQAGASLPEALRELAGRCSDNFYLHQLAELVAINISAGGDLSGSLARLTTRMRTMAELRAEETAELFGYRWLTRILFTAGLLPLPYWALTRSGSIQVFSEQPIAQAGLIWAVASGLAIISLPYWMAIDD